jgi:hypothetical protein
MLSQSAFVKRQGTTLPGQYNPRSLYRDDYSGARNALLDIMAEAHRGASISHFNSPNNSYALATVSNRLNARSSISWIIHNFFARGDGLPPNLSTKVLKAKSNIQGVHIVLGLGKLF